MRRGIVGDVRQAWHFGAARLCDRAALAETAADRRRQQVRRHAVDGSEFAHPGLIQPRHRPHQPHRIGVRRRAKNIARRAAFDDLRGIHHVDPVGKGGDDAEIMGNQDDGDTETLGNVLQQFEYLRLNGDVERRCWFVGDDQLRLARQTNGDHRALAHAAGKLMRVLGQTLLRFGYADQTEQLDRARIRLFPVHLKMRDHRFGQLIADRQNRVQASHRFLENHRYVPAPQGSHLRFRQLRNIAAVEHYPRGRYPCRLARQQPHQRQGRDRFAAARFTDDCQKFAAAHLKTNAIDGAHDAGAGREFDFEILHTQKNFSLDCRFRYCVHDKLPAALTA